MFLTESEKSKSLDHIISEKKLTNFVLSTGNGHFFARHQYILKKQNFFHFSNIILKYVF